LFERGVAARKLGALSQQKRKRERCIKYEEKNKQKLEGRKCEEKQKGRGANGQTGTGRGGAEKVLMHPRVSSRNLEVSWWIKKSTSSSRRTSVKKRKGWTLWGGRSLPSSVLSRINSYAEKKDKTERM